MSSLNKVMLIGRLGRDPEIRYTKSGSGVANFSIATDERWKDKEGNRQERTEWHSIVAWGKLADFAQNYLKKGKLVFIEGRLQTRDWTDTQNVKHYKTEINAKDIRFMEKLDDSQRAAGAGAARPDRPQRQERAAAAPERGAPPASFPDDQGGDPGPEGEYLEDDIPF